MTVPYEKSALFLTPFLVCSLSKSESCLSCPGYLRRVQQELFNGEDCAGLGILDLEDVLCSNLRPDAPNGK